MNNELKIRTLVNRFFDGETTLAEEQQLYAYFSQEPAALPEDLRPLRRLFLDFEAVDLSSYDATSSHHSRRKGSSTLIPWRRWATAAVAAVVLAGGALLLFHRHAEANAAEEEYVAYIYGQRTTDRDVVLGEMQNTMTAMAGGSDDTVEEQLKAMFCNE